METINATTISVNTIVNAPIEKVWDYFTGTKHITSWYQASDDWHAPYAENDLTPGGKFKTTMAAKDGSFSFDFGGVYTVVEKHRRIAYTLDDGRKVNIDFEANGDATKIEEAFEAENTHSVEMQQGGWQAILDSFKKYTESH
ncbi:MAG TPA: SRPBCC family protein [Flavisolibacter sp.]